MLTFTRDPEEINWHVEVSSGGVEAYVESFLYSGDIYYIMFGQSPFTYSIQSGECTITGIRQGYVYTASEAVYIPENINGAPVTSIAAEAFMGRSDVRKAYIPGSVSSVGARAFKGCSNLQAVFFAGEGSTSLGQDTFQNCPQSLGVYVDIDRGCGNLADWAPVTQSLIIYDRIGSDLFEMGSEWADVPIASYLSGAEMYNWSDYDVDWDPQEYDWQEPFLAYVLRYYLVRCELSANWSFSGSLEMHLCLDLGSAYEGRAVYLLDEDGGYLDEGEVEDGLLEFVSYDFVSGGCTFFHLFPADQSAIPMSIDPDGVYFHSNEIVWEDLYIDDVFDLTWYQNYL